MKPCSAYCRPEENRHTFLEYLLEGRSALGLKATVAARARSYCLPEGTRFVVVGEEPAAEAPPTSDEQYPFAVLLTVEVLS